jgi:elongation factor Ts
MDLLRQKGAASADRKSSRIASEGVIGQWIDPSGAAAVMMEVNCETDFVAKDESFLEFVHELVTLVSDKHPQNVQQLVQMELDSERKVEDARLALVGRIGENITIRRFQNIVAQPGSRLSGYLHGQRIGVIVETNGGSIELGKDLAMHIAASRPLAVSEAELPEEILERERKIVAAQAAETGKSENIIDKIVSGRIKKFVADNTLLGQSYVKNTEITVAELLQSEDGSVTSMLRYEVGEGLEKREDDFVADVMAQARAG